MLYQCTQHIMKENLLSLKYMTWILKLVYIDKLGDIIKEYKDTYHRTIKMKPVDVKSSTYIDFDKEQQGRS